MENGTDYRVWLVREDSRGWPDEPQKQVKAVFAVTECEQDARTLVRVLRENEYEATLEKTVWQGSEEISVHEVEVGDRQVATTVGPHLFALKKGKHNNSGVQFSLRMPEMGQGPDDGWSDWYDFGKDCVVWPIDRVQIRMRVHPTVKEHANHWAMTRHLDHDNAD